MKKLLFLSIFTLLALNAKTGLDDPDVICCNYNRRRDLALSQPTICPTSFEDAKKDSRFSCDFHSSKCCTKNVVDCACTCTTDNCVGWCGKTIKGDGKKHCQKIAKNNHDRCGMQCTGTNERYTPYLLFIDGDNSFDR